MKPSWPQKTLAEVLQKTETIDPLRRPEEEFDYIDVSSVSNLTFRIEETQRLKGKDAPSRARRLVRTGDVLFATVRPTLRRIAVVPDGLDGQVCSTGYFVLRPKPEVHHRFVFYFLQSGDFMARMEELQKGASYPAVTDGEVRAQNFPVPSSAEQQRIVGILDEAVEGIAKARANAERNLKNAHALFESHLQSVFKQRGPGWVDRKVSEIAKHSLGKMLDKSKNRGELKPYLRNQNVRWFTFDLSDLLEMPFLSEETGKYTAVKGDVLICEGGYPGRSAIWTEDYPIHFQKALHRVRFHEPGHSQWFVFYLFSKDQSGDLKGNFSGTGIQHFTGEALARFSIPIPPPQQLESLVAKFVELLAETLRLASLYTRKLAALDELKKSLLHQAFTGQL